MNQDQEQVAIKLTDSCETHEDWLTAVRFLLAHLLQSPPLLMEVIVREASRQCERSESQHRVPADDARLILSELGLTLRLGE